VSRSEVGTEGSQRQITGTPRRIESETEVASNKKLVADEPVSRILRAKLQTNKLFRINPH